MSDPTFVPFRPNTCTFNAVAMKGAAAFRYNVAPANTARFDGESGGQTLAIAYHEYLGDFSLDGQDPVSVAAIDLAAATTAKLNSSAALSVSGLDLRGGGLITAAIASAIVSNVSGGWDRSGANSNISGNFLLGSDGATGILITQAA